MKLANVFKRYGANATATGTGVVLIGAMSQVEDVDPNIQLVMIALVGLGIMFLNRLATKNNADGSPDTEPYKPADQPDCKYPPPPGK